MDLNLLIVDDEALTRECLSDYIDWKNLNISETKTASNGIQALETAKTFQPDILITDIKMPHMSGIELSHKFKLYYPACKIIFISGYAEKEYLKSAIDLKVEAYIDKPVTSGNVEQTVAKVVQTIRKEREKHQQEIILSHNLNRTQYIVRREIAQALIQPNLNWDKFLIDFVPSYFSWEEEHPYTVVCLRIHSQMELSFAQSICAHLEQFLCDNDLMNSYDFYIGLIENNCPFFITAICSSAVLQSIFALLTENIKSVFQLNSTAVIGPTVNSLRSISLSCRIANTALDYFHMYYYTQSIFNCHFELAKKTAPEDLFRKKYISEGELNDLFTCLSREKYTNIDDIRHKLFNLYHTALQNETAQNRISWETFKEYSLQECIMQIKNNFIAIPLEYNYEKYDAKTRQAIQYIQACYSNKELSLKMISDAIELSQNYFSTLFKQNTGMTVNDFIVRVRIERAKYLLRSTNLKLYEIGDKIGIPDANYLNILFKKNCQITPTQYRRNA